MGDCNRACPEKKKSRMYFSHTTAVYHCNECGSSLEVVSPNLSKFFWIAIGAGFIPTYIIAVWGSLGMQWYDIISILAGETLLLYGGSFLAIPIFWFIEKRAKSGCDKCHSITSLRGRYFAPSEKPHSSDFVLLAVFIALNIFVWFRLA